MNRAPLVITATAGLLIAGLPPAVAAATPSCTQWGFNGMQTFLMSEASGPVMLNVMPMPSAPSAVPTPATETGGINGKAGFEIEGSVTSVISGDQLTMTFSSSQRDGTQQLTGQIGPDGSAQGTVVGTSTSWHSLSPLKCIGSA